VIDLLKGYFKIGDRDDHREMRDKVLGRVLGLDRAFEPLLPPLLALLDVPVEDAAWQNLDPPQRRQRTLESGCSRASRSFGRPDLLDQVLRRVGLGRGSLDLPGDLLTTNSAACRWSRPLSSVRGPGPGPSGPPLDRGRPAAPSSP
jgi:hypothetical protein